MADKKKENTPTGAFSREKRRTDLMTQSAFSECIIRANPENFHITGKKMGLFFELAQNMQSNFLIFVFLQRAVLIDSDSFQDERRHIRQFSFSES